MKKQIIFCLVACFLPLAFTAASIAQTKTYRQVGPILHVAFSHDDKWIASTGRTFGAINDDGSVDISGFRGEINGDGFVEVQSLEDRKKSYRLIVRSTGANMSSFAPDGETIAVACEDGKCREFDVAKGTVASEFDVGKFPVKTVAYSADGSKIVTSDESGAAIVWDRENRKRLVEFEKNTEGLRFASFCFNDQGIVTIAANGVMTLWPAKGGEKKFAKKTHNAKITAVDISRNQKFVATADENGMIQVWAIGDGAELAKLSGHEGTVYSLDFSPTHRGLVSVGKDKKVQFWSLGDRKVIKTKSLVPGLGVAFSNDGATIAIGRSDSITVVMSTSD